jgi:hypothetical protein
MGIYISSLIISLFFSFFITEDLRRQKDEKLKKMDKMIAQ